MYYLLLSSLLLNIPREEKLLELSNIRAIKDICMRGHRLVRGHKRCVFVAGDIVLLGELREELGQSIWNASLAKGGPLLA
jgi:hypothetical protein